MAARSMKWKRLSPGEYRAFGDTHRYLLQRVDDTWFLEAKQLQTLSDLEEGELPSVIMRRCESKREGTELALELEQEWET